MKYLFAALDMLFFEIIIKFNWSNISSSNEQLITKFRRNIKSII